MKTHKKLNIQSFIAGVYLLLVIVLLIATYLRKTTLSLIILAIFVSPWSGLFLSAINAINPALIDQGYGLFALFAGGMINTFLIFIGSRWFINKIVSN